LTRKQYFSATCCWVTEPEGVIQEWKAWVTKVYLTYKSTGMFKAFNFQLQKDETLENVQTPHTKRADKTVLGLKVSKEAGIA